MKKWILMLVGILFLTASSIGWGASPAFQQIRRDNTEMRRSLTWLMEGLLSLTKSSDKNLVLKPEQKKKILPIFQALVQAKIIVLTKEPKGRSNNDQSNGQNGQQNQGRFIGQHREFDPNDPKAHERLKKMQEQTAFGNKQADLIDQILTKKQVTFIDNLDFQPEKYGYLDLRKLMGNNQNGETGQTQKPDAQTMAKLRQQMQTGRDNLIKLNQAVYELLKK